MRTFLVHCKAFIDYLQSLNRRSFRAARNNQEKLYSVLGLCFTLFLLLSSCTSTESRKRVAEWEQWKQPNSKLKVLSTTGMIDDIAKQVGANHVDTLVLISGELDPHSYQLVKGDDEKLLCADVIFFNGLGLEHHPSLRNHLHDNPKAVGLGDRLKTDHPDSILYFEGQLDPHIWMDISLWAQTIKYVVATLSERDSEHAQEYALNGNLLYDEYLVQHENIKALMESISAERRYLVTSHDAFHYFTKAYLATTEEKQDDTWRKRFAAPEGLSPESQLSTLDIQVIIDHLNKYHIEVVFAENNVSSDSLRKIVHAGKERGLNVAIANATLYADALGKPGSDGDTYLKMIQYNAQTIQRVLKQETMP